VLHIHRAERADGLVDMLGELVVDPLDDAMATEVVAVPTRGVERWVTQQLASRLGATPGRSDGVCANIDFPFPGTLVGGALAAASGVDRDTDPWAAERAVWPLLEVVDSCLDEPWLAALAAHLNSAGQTRRVASVRHVADLFDRYGVHRPEMLRAWASGRDDNLRPDSRWQAQLWRQLREAIGKASPAERLDEACTHLMAKPELVDLPARLSLFGLTRLPASYLDVLSALARARDVHLFLLHPSPVLWARVSQDVATPKRGIRRTDDPTAELTNNPLLASWGQDAREMQLVLGAAGAGTMADHHRPVDDSPGSLLQRVQADIRADRAPPGVPLPGRTDGRVLVDPSDDSIQVHACHGRARQVEVLRDAILHLLADNPELEPRDVIVMCPDIEAYAPLVYATFGSHQPDQDDGDPGELPDLRVRLADRSLRQTNPILGVVAQLLELAAGRVTATEVLDLAGRPPVRRRFGFDDDDLTRLEEWVVGAGVRWGLDANHRAPFQLDRLAANTWRTGVDRMLLGVTMPDEGQRLFGDVLPLDDMDSGDIELAGRLAELLDRLEAAVDGLSGTNPVGAWARSISEFTDTLCATSDGDAWQAQQLRGILDELIDQASVDGTASMAPLGLPDMQALLAERLKGRPTRANFRTGHLTICTLVPMRSVPHRVVGLLGLDDGVFPRHTERDGDDLILADPHIGDRDARSEDRQLLLDALLAAQDKVVITYTGRDERTNHERPPAVPVGELLDVIDRTARTDSGADARQQVVVHHPLQPFDARNFALGALIAKRPWSFDPVNLAGARALSGEQPPHRPFLRGLLPAFDVAAVELDHLERFVRHPVGAFLRLRLGIRLGDWVRDVDDALPVELDGLERWGVAERMLSARLAGAGLDACLVAERARGALPPGALADRVLQEIIPTVEQLVAIAHDDREPTSFDVNVALPDGTSLVGTVAGLRGSVIHRVTFSRLAPNHRLFAWVRLLALTAAWPQHSFEALTVGRIRDGGRRTISVARIPVLSGDPVARQEYALLQLSALVDLFRLAMREPVPLYLKTSAAWAEAVHQGRDPKEAASKEWTSLWNFDREDKDPEHQLVLGDVVPFDAIAAVPPRQDEEGNGWSPDEPSRLGRYARRLWDGLLAIETVTDQ
jgi:exodeoxyribonuclease V gamma subunit